VGAATVGVVALKARGGEYEKSTVTELKGMLKEKNLPVSGTKAELIERLLEASGGAGKAAPKKETKAVKKDAGKETKAAPKKEIEAKNEEEKADDEPEAGYIEDAHLNKPDTIVDDEGRTRFLCLDGRYRRGDPDAIKLESPNLHAWLSEWIVAARTGQLEGKPQKYFMVDEKQNPGNPTGKTPFAGKVIHSDEVLKRLPDGSDGFPRWEVKEGYKVA